MVTCPLVPHHGHGRPVVVLIVIVGSTGRMVVEVIVIVDGIGGPVVLIIVGSIGGRGVSHWGEVDSRWAWYTTLLP